MNSKTINCIENLRQALRDAADENFKQSGKRFFKENELADNYGVRFGQVTKIDKKYYNQLKGAPKQDIFALCEELLQSGMLEEGAIAANWAYNVRKQFTDDDFPMFERWVEQYVTNWAACDTLCIHTMAAFVEMYPAHLEDLKRWAYSENRWMKRAAAVTLILPARNGKFHDTVFEIAEILLSDTDDMVQKGYGWALKEASKRDQKRVYEYVLSKRAVMPRTALRYAIEKMPLEMRAEAMRKV